MAAARLAIARQLPHTLARASMLAVALLHLLVVFMLDAEPRKAVDDSMLGTSRGARNDANIVDTLLRSRCVGHVRGLRRER
jgi:hypothetical protein